MVIHQIHRSKDPGMKTRSKGKRVQVECCFLMVTRIRFPLIFLWFPYLFVLFFVIRLLLLGLSNKGIKQKWEKIKWNILAPLPILWQMIESMGSWVPGLIGQSEWMGHFSALKNRKQMPISWPRLPMAGQTSILFPIILHEH